MPRIPRDSFTYEFSADTPPVARVAPGDRVVVETYDTSTGRIHHPEDVPNFLRVRDPRKVNPAAGPIYVEGAAPGDALVVEILDIRLPPQGFVRVLAGAGVLQDGIEPNGLVMVRVDGGDLVFGERVRFRARPMVGVVGTAPAGGVVYTAEPGPQGSNVDINAIAVGARVHLPVHVPGALLAIGDVHAAMGDGEVSGTGVEINAEVTVGVRIEKGAAPARPWIETAEHWIATGSGPTLEAAVEIAVEGLCRLLVEQLRLSRTEAFLLVSARGDVRIGQCARIPGLDATAYALFPRAVERLAPSEPPRCGMCPVTNDEGAIMAAVAAVGTEVRRRDAPEKLTGRARYAVKADTGVRLTQIPATPERVLTALRQQPPDPRVR